jgi:hypothetical protein
MKKVVLKGGYHTEIQFIRVPMEAFGPMRVFEVTPTESWKVSPTIYEESAVEGLAKVEDGPPCTCGKPSAKGIVHRYGLPCYHMDMTDADVALLQEIRDALKMDGPAKENPDKPETWRDRPPML